MLRTSLLTLALAAVLALAPSTANAQFGFTAGLNFDDAGGFASTDATAGSIYESATGYHLGIFLDAGFGFVAVRPGIYYRSIGNYEAAGEEYGLSLVDVGLDLRYSFLPLPFVKPYLLAGPLFSFPQTDSDAFAEALNDVAVAANVGLGVSLSPPGFGLRIMPELRYAFGLSGFVTDEEFSIGDTTFLPDSERLNSFQLRLNVAF